MCWWARKKTLRFTLSMKQSPAASWKFLQFWRLDVANSSSMQMPHMSYLHTTYNLCFFSTGNPCGWYPDMSAVLRLFRRRNSYNGIFEESFFRAAQSIDDSHGVHTECFCLGTEKTLRSWNCWLLKHMCIYINRKMVHGRHSIAQINYFFSRSLVILNAVPGRMYPRLLN